MKHHTIHLTKRERSKLRGMLQKGTHPVRVVKRAQALLKSEEGLTDENISEQIGIGLSTVARLRERYCTSGVDGALSEAARSGRPVTFTKDIETRIIAVACTNAPEGRCRWTMELLAEEARRQGIVSHISPPTVWAMLKEHDLKPWLKKNVVHSEAHSGVQGAHGRSH